jgi:hypothetical protein
MNQPKRYDLTIDESRVPSMKETQDGHYVTYEDYAVLEARFKAADKAVKLSLHHIAAENDFE